MRFRPEHYLEAASERIEQAEDLFRIGHYSLAIDTAGRARSASGSAHLAAVAVKIVSKLPGYSVPEPSDHKYKDLIDMSFLMVTGRPG